jgi:hypothetical protein
LPRPNPKAGVHYWRNDAGSAFSWKFQQKRNHKKLKFNHLFYNKLSGWKDYSGNFLKKVLDFWNKNGDNSVKHTNQLV